MWQSEKAGEGVNKGNVWLVAELLLCGGSVGAVVEKEGVSRRMLEYSYIGERRRWLYIGVSRLRV